MKGESKPLVRIHSECFTGDVINSSHCDCGSQLNKSMELIYQNGCGVIIYPCNHEGRGIGFTNKIKAYQLMKWEKSIDTYSANKLLGFEEDLRDYSHCVSVLKDLKMDSFTLLTTNPYKIQAMSPFDITTVSLDCGSLPFNEKYLTAKAKKHNYFKNNGTFVFKKIGIVHSGWYMDIIGPFVEKLKKEIPIEIVKCVPGSFEIPLEANRLCETLDIIICIGAIIKGETYHFEVLSQTVCDSLMNIQLKTGKPVLNYVLNAYTLTQVKERFTDPVNIVNTVKHFC